MAFFLLFPIFKANAIGWPANYEGVMLQGFYWDSYSDTKWTTLESQADELSKYFDLIWVPNSGKCSNSTSMGYDPVYWFTNHNSSFGTEAQIRQMIKTFKSKGVGIIEDVVVNHRNGKSNWWDFPAETWNGTTYQLTNGSITSTDEMWSSSDAGAKSCPASYKGSADTGEDFNGCRDLDHTNATVQNNIKAYCKFLLEDMGYAGFRLDMVKGYGGQYTKIYNEYSKPEFSVGEYFDSNYDLVAAWIEATGKTSAAFDFPCKYQINKAFTNGIHMNELMWMENGVNPQPAGMIHHWYQQYSVTFVDNHDTYRDGSKFADENHELAANAFILGSPGTPCIFLPHYKKYKTQIQTMILARKAAGISNTSKVVVEQSNDNCYMAIAEGYKGKLAIKIGPAMVSPQGFEDSEIVISGNDFCMWLKGAKIDAPVPTPDASQTKEYTVYFDNSTAKWTTPHIHYWGSSESTWPGVAMTKYDGNVWTYTVPAGTTGILFNAGDGDPSKTQDFVGIPDHLYDTTGDLGRYSGSVSQEPFQVYFNNSSSNWATPYIHYWGASESTWPGVAMSKESGNVWTYTVPGGTTGILFNAGDGDATKTSDFEAYPNHIYTVAGDNGVYTPAGIESLEIEDSTPVFYNLQGLRVENPSKGIFIKVTGEKREKVYLR